MQTLIREIRMHLYGAIPVAYILIPISLESLASFFRQSFETVSHNNGVTRH